MSSIHRVGAPQPIPPVIIDLEGNGPVSGQISELVDETLLGIAPFSSEVNFNGQNLLVLQPTKERLEALENLNSRIPKLLGCEVTQRTRLQEFAMLFAQYPDMLVSPDCQRVITDIDTAFASNQIATLDDLSINEMQVEAIEQKILNLLQEQTCKMFFKLDKAILEQSLKKQPAPKRVKILLIIQQYLNLDFIKRRGGQSTELCRQALQTIAPELFGIIQEAQETQIPLVYRAEHAFLGPEEPDYSEGPSVDAFLQKYSMTLEKHPIHAQVYKLLTQYLNLFPQDQLEPGGTHTFSPEQISQLAPLATKVLNSAGVISNIQAEAQRIINNDTQAASAMLRDIVTHSYALFVKTTTYGFSYSGIVQNAVLQISVEKAQKSAATVDEDFKAATSLQQQFTQTSIADDQEQIQIKIRKLSTQANSTANYIQKLAKDRRDLLGDTTSRQLNELLENLNNIAQSATVQSNQIATLRRQVDTSIWKASKGRHVASHQILQSNQDMLRRKLMLEASQAKYYEGVTNPEYSEDVMDTLTPTPETVSMPKLETAGLTRVDSHNTLGLNRDHEDSLQVADTEVIEAVDQYYALFNFMYRLYGVHSTAVNINELKAEAEQYGITDIDGLKNKINEFAHIELPEDLDSLDDIIAGISAVFSKVQDVFESADIALTGLPKKEDLMTEFQKGQNDTLKTLLRKMLVFTADKALEPVFKLSAVTKLASNLNFFNRRDQSVATVVIDAHSPEQAPNATATDIRAYVDGAISGQRLKTSWSGMGVRIAGKMVQLSSAENAEAATLEGNENEIAEMAKIAKIAEPLICEIRDVFVGIVRRYAPGN